MKQIFLFALILMTACKTVHKSTNESKVTIDSTKVITKDTTSVIKESTSTAITNAKDIKIKIVYGDSTVTVKDGTIVNHPTITTKPIKTGSNKLNDIIGDAISASGNAGKIPSSIEISIGSIGDSITANSKTDSTHVKGNDSTKLQAQKEDYTKNVDKSGPTVGDYIVMVLIALAVIAILLFKNKLRI